MLQNHLFGGNVNFNVIFDLQQKSNSEDLVLISSCILLKIQQ